jgi:hypothetical protein
MWRPGPDRLVSRADATRASASQATHPRGGRSVAALRLTVNTRCKAGSARLSRLTTMQLATIVPGASRCSNCSNGAEIRD